MSYDYQTERPWLFTEEGQLALLKIRDRFRELLEKAGACRMHEAVFCAGVGGDAWKLLACADRLVELREIQEISRTNIMGQDRVFVNRSLLKEHQ